MNDGSNGFFAFLFTSRTISKKAGSDFQSVTPVTVPLGCPPLRVGTLDGRKALGRRCRRLIACSSLGMSRPTQARMRGLCRVARGTANTDRHASPLVPDFENRRRPLLRPCRLRSSDVQWHRTPLIGLAVTGGSMKRQRNDGIRKVCRCPRRSWSKCPHPWHFSYKWDGTHYRFSLDRHLGRRVESKTEAKAEAERLKGEIRAGRFGPQAVPDRMRLCDLLDQYHAQHVEPHRPTTAKDERYRINFTTRTLIPRPNGSRVAFGGLDARELTTGDVELFIADRLKNGKGSARGRVSINRNLALLRAAYNWGIRKDYVERTPFKVGTVSAIRFFRETPRQRRLESGEEERLLAACSPHLRSVLVAALETCCRIGELLSLQCVRCAGSRTKSISLPRRRKHTEHDSSLCRNVSRRNYKCGNMPPMERCCLPTPTCLAMSLASE